MSRRIGVAFVIVTTVALAVSGCVAIPTSGAVSSAEVTRESEAGLVGFLPIGPEKGASQEEILDGFLRAGVGPEDRYRVAREYLSTDFSATWNPNETVYITDGTALEAERTGDDSLTIDIQVTAHIDASGAYTGLDQAEEQPFAVDFVQEDGEWRISSAPNAVVLSRNNFNAIFAPLPIYFFDPTGQFLVPDLRWFPVIRTTTERVVRAMLDGPGPALAGAVVSAFPEGTQLGAGDVDLEGGQASVNLPSQVLAEPAATKRRMLQQLEASLLLVRSVTSVRLTVGGFAVDVPDSGGAGPSVDPLADSSPLGYRDGIFGYLSAGDIRPVPGLGDQLTQLTPIAATLSRDQTVAAVLTAAGAVYLAAGSDPTLVDDRPGLVPPTIDPENFLWSAAAADPTSIQAISAKGERHPLALATPFPADSRVVSIDLSRDGTRLLVGLATPSGPRLELMAVLRDAELTPTGLGPIVELPLGVSGALLDTAWVDSGSVSALVAQESGVVARVVQIGGRSNSLGLVPDAVQLVGGNGAAGLRGRDGAGALMVPSGAGSWRATGVMVQFLATQQ